MDKSPALRQTRSAPLVAICGTANSSPAEDRLAERAGFLLAQRGATVICGGLTGIMTSAARGTRRAGGTVIGFLPGDDPVEGNPYLSYAIPTGLGELRNGLIARASVAMLTIGGGYGTLSEIGFMLRLGRPVACLESWGIYPPHQSLPDQGVFAADSADEAVEWLWKALA